MRVDNWFSIFTNAIKEIINKRIESFPPTKSELIGQIYFQSKYIWGEQIDYEVIANALNNLIATGQVFEVNHKKRRAIGSDGELYVRRDIPKVTKRDDRLFRGIVNVIENFRRKCFNKGCLYDCEKCEVFADCTYIFNIANTYLIEH